MILRPIDRMGPDDRPGTASLLRRASASALGCPDGSRLAAASEQFFSSDQGAFYLGKMERHVMLWSLD